jgi:hypothetical protein
MIFVALKFLPLTRFRFIIILYLFVILFSNQSNAQNNNSIYSFGADEKITYEVAYNWHFVWVSAGEVSFTVKNAVYRGKPAFHFEGTGSSFKSYDWFYKVRDHFESFVDTSSLLPIWAGRTSNEGGYEVFEEYNYDYTLKKLYSVSKTSKRLLRNDTLNLNFNVYDLVTAIYYARNIDFSKYKINDKIPIWVVSVGKAYPLYIRYLGKEVLTTHDKKKYNCIKFSAKLIDGTVFKGGEDMFAWVTDDQNHIAVQVEAKIIVGSIKAYVKKTENLRNKCTSLIE